MPHRQDEDSGESSGGIHALDRIGGSRPVFGAFSLSLSLSLSLSRYKNLLPLIVLSAVHVCVCVCFFSLDLIREQ